MADDSIEEEDLPKKKGILIPLLIGLVLAGGAGAGGFWAVTSGPLSGLIGGAQTTEDGDYDSHGDDYAGDHGDGDGDGHGDGYGDEEEAGYSPPPPRPDLVEVSFVPLEPLVISLGTAEHGRHLLFSAELEVAPGDEDAVSHLTPRVMDVMNSYLRLIDLNELNDPRTLVRIRAQLLRRVQIVTGETMVRDLLVTEFVVN